jgi:hypothetical protein
MADWFSGIGSMLAVIVALLGHWIIEWQRKRDCKAAELEHARRIGFKITVLYADAHHSQEHLQKNATMDELKEPSLLWRRLQPELSIEALTGPELNTAEQNSSSACLRPSCSCE